ncbi:response regulator transcription factor [Paenibacillus thiaminolyticus]|uniref:Response regulator transcription factor n=1 Tax=Paenibacillus thiaminolyticus TaxID=49283 RepID=A0AAP9J027_PANTH|nr:response regulator transcription factor [Paenibacillus thiaminolyticus]MCY9538006.1 response regulator transcription factor [Paenibacillus thiaminolyticus]MCY9604928.1 response regulator transcription factor [Paenibacillus thiaminolyticus]MCY9610663.1 response regulator transcription factor [Paenibacillus thiaminolyticus]MCY9615992.1 response regulator transcription factor [Paenibacillus thiaminolyticus]MCY9622398.1 response regulator transcription factor [Paenibacillus thiaminolyticus]
MSYHILVVEDDGYIQELIKEFLTAHSYLVDVADNGLEAWQMMERTVYDLVILDVMLPNIDGFSLCRMIRSAQSAVPIIMLTALSEEKDQLKAFELEADDYIAKPFSFNVLVKRVEAVLRRAKNGNPALPVNDMTFERLRIDLNSYKVYVDEEWIDMTMKEFEILQALLENIGRVMTREMLLERIWGYDYYGDSRIVDAHIKNIRKKIGLPYIKTVKGLGYMMERENG